MTLELIMSAPGVVQFHLGSAIVAVGLGPVALYRSSRDRWHKLTGYVWAGAMLALAVSGFFMHTLAIIGPFGPIHLFSVFTIFSLWRGYVLIRARRIADHARWMRNFFWNAIGFAGVLAFLPGRTLNRAVFAAQPELAYWFVTGCLAVGLAWMATSKGRGRTKPTGE